MSEVKTEKLSPRVTSLQLGDSGDTFTVPSGATLDINGTADFAGATVSGLSAGKVLQVLSVNDTTVLTLSSTTYTDTGLTQAITPSASSSKVLIMFNAQAHLHQYEGFGVKLLRDSTGILESANSHDVYSVGDGQRLRGSWIYLDSPSTTSSVTYKVQASSFASNTIEMNSNGHHTSMTLMEIGA